METDDLIYLVSCAVNETAPDAERVKTMDLDALYQEAARHSLRAITAYALEAAGVRDPRFTHAKEHAALKNAQMDMEMDAVLAELEAAGIWYMPLKGILLQHLYPVYGMREMSDHDILIDKSRAGDVTSIMEKLGFYTESVDEYAHDLYRKEPVCNFEMHRTLFYLNPENPSESALYYQNVKERLIKEEGKQYGYHFTPEDLYVYLTAHEYKHYDDKGTGLRSLLDIYVYLKKTPLDMDYVAAEMEKLGIADFETANRGLALRLFSQEALTGADKDLLENRFLPSGVYGSQAQKIKNKIAKEGGRWKYFLARLTPPYEKMLPKYPFLEKLPFLYPFCCLHRLIYKFFTSHKKFIMQVKAVLGMKIK